MACDPDNARVGIPARQAAAHPRRWAAHAAAVEDVLCVPRATIFPDGAWHGLVTRGLERILRTVNASSEYRPRSDVEDEPDLQQIIPYCVVHHPHDDTYLITRRLRRSSEKRLHHLYSLGIGGHVNPGDGEAGDPVVGGLRREWAEEIRCSSPATARLVAAINDDSSPVSRVHLGLVFLVEPTLGVSVTPTRIRASEKINVIPSRAELDVDCRVPPELGEDEARARVEEVLGPAGDGYRLEFLERVVGNRSPFAGPLVNAMRDWLGGADPEGELVPTMLPGFSAAKIVRSIASVSTKNMPGILKS